MKCRCIFADSNKSWFAVGEYKRLENEVGGNETTLSSDVPIKMKQLLKTYNKSKEKTIEDNLKDFYYHGLKEWTNEKGYLIDTCLTAQDRFKKYLDYFGIDYRD